MMLTLPSTDTIIKAVELASRAPSLHNSQPWRWQYGRTGLNLFADTSKLMPSADSAGRELILSCGAMLHHFRVAMASLGWKSIVDRFPNPNQPMHLARLQFSRSEFVTDAERELADAIRRRRTVRLPFGAPIGWDMFEEIVRPTLGTTTMTVVPEVQMPEIWRASELADSMRRYDSGYHAELHWWTGHAGISDGVPGAVLPTATEHERVPSGRDFPVQNGPDRSATGAPDEAKVIILSTDSDGLKDVLQCGEAMSAVLLEATVAGWATCPLTHIIEVRGSWSIVQRLVGGTLSPQILIRIGARPDEAASAALTPRRALSDILEIQM